MAILLQKSKVMKVAGVSLVMLLAACSSDQRYKHQVDGNTSYLDAAPMKALNIPQGMILPLQSGQYDIPVVNADRPIGTALDIRPPTQTISLLAGSRAENNLDASRLLLESSPENSTLWLQLNSILEKKGFPISERNEGAQEILTDWVVWERADENVPYQSRQRIKVEPNGYQIAIVVTSEGLKQGTETISDKQEIARYNALTMNEIVDGLDRLRNAARSESNNNQYGLLEVQSGSDKTGLPQLIVRAPYEVVWDRLPTALESIGIKVGDRSRSNGSIEVTYKGMSSSAWNALGIDDPTMQEGDYTIQVGDLNNRSSLQFIGSKGKTLTQKENDEMVKALSAAFSKPAK